MTTSPVLTLSEFLKLPETKPASEYIHGRIYQKPLPQRQMGRGTAPVRYLI
ncbi:hypothetical protein NIES37_47850 [Tolypothrix tenuis PCC 7101]|uniref:Restriction endonuclease domain-containing protein n=1 Tax=Tolypothrix tenuis PCC 7101 TaxID=231146 RepID=A0A1Z4N4W9_9CYAN|nr:hypothetical protein NIES37_47850 [Tolypothrix tenuis PCC 7101]BAZ75288.1 hypothetical protein NIES50_38700 [Aulosira laxa NIES-50]